jgi:hypothetical protein
MDTSLKAARDYIYNDRSWASTGKTLDGRVDTCILRALRDISGEVPEALVPEDKHIHVRKSIVGSDSTINATIQSTADLKVLKFNIDASSTWAPTVDRTWDGIMHLEVTDSDGRVRRRQCREWWYDADVPEYYVSIDRPWIETSASTTYDFRIYQPEFFLPANAIEILTPMQLFDDSEQLVGQISSGTARREYLPDFRQRVQGRPTDFWRGRFFQLPSPTEAPRVRSLKTTSTDFNIGVTNLPWAGPMPAGKFEFCFTYAWGRKEQEWGETQSLFADPEWESAPSPISEAFDHATEFDTVNPLSPASGAYKAARAISIEMSNLEEMLDFVGFEDGVPLDGSYTNPPSGAPLRYGRSGLRLRLYVRRLATYSDYGPNAKFTETRATTTSFPVIPASARLNRVEADGKFYLLTELNPLDVDPLAADMTSSAYFVSNFTWQGRMQTVNGQKAIVPDPTRQLIKTTGYYAYHIWPTPDQNYDLDAQVLMQPKELVNDQDQVPVKQEAFSAFLELALAYMSRLDGVDQNSEVKHRTLYRQLVRRFRSQHGDNNGIVENRAWGDIRPRYRYGTFSEG